MNAPIDFAALESALYEKPLFRVDPPDSRRDWAEADRQATFRGRLKMIAPSLICFANANGGLRHRGNAVKEGVTPGVFDLTVTNGTVGARFTAYAEFKGWQKKRAGALSREQTDWGNMMWRAGHNVACFFDPDAAVEWIRTIAPNVFIDRVGRL